MQVGVGRAHGEIVEAVAVDVGERRERHARVRVLLEAVVAAADRRGRRHRIGAQSGARERRGRDVGGMRRAEDDVDGAAAALARRAGHGSADRDVGEAVVVDVVADHRVAQHLARVPVDVERGVREVERRGCGGQRRAVLAEEDVDDARVGVRGRQPDGVVADVVAVDVAQLGHGRERAGAGRRTEGRQRVRGQCARADAAREHAEADDRDRQREHGAGLSQEPSAHAVRARLTRAGTVIRGAAGMRARLIRR